MSADAGGDRNVQEASLLARCRNRDEAAWREMYATHSASVGRYLRYLCGHVSDSDLDDMVQQVFVCAVQSLSDFRVQSSLRTWLFGIAQNVRDRFARGEYRHARRGRSLSEREPSVACDTAERSHYREALRVTEDALEEMDPRLRVTWLLVEVEGMSMGEAAEALGVPLGTVQSRLFRARSAIIDALVDAGYGSEVTASESGTVVPLRRECRTVDRGRGPGEA